MKVNTAHATARTGRRRVLLAMSWHEHSQIEGISRYAAKAGWILRHWNGQQHAGIHEFKPHGVIYQLHQDANREMLASLSRMHQPMVDMYHFAWPTDFSHQYDFRSSRAVSRVYMDIKAMGAMAAEHLAERGFSRLVYVGGASEWPSYQGFMHAATKRHCELIPFFNTDPDIARQIYGEQPHATLYHDEWSLSRQKWAGRTFANLPKPVGVFADNDVWASDIIDGCLAARMLVPEQIAVVAAADADCQGACFSVPTTVIVPDFEHHGYQAAALLDRLMNSDSPPSTVRILIPPKRIVQRESTLIQASENLRVARAISYILRNLHRNSLSSVEVCAHSGASVTSLYRAFSQHLGMPVADYIEKLRLKEATGLLETTGMTASAIAEQCGFSELRHFRKALCRATRMTPSAYRRRHPRTHTNDDLETPPGDRQHSIMPQEAQVEAQLKLPRWQLDVLAACSSGPKTGKELLAVAGYHTRTGNFKKGLHNLVANKLIEFTIPGKPNSRLQSYRLTTKGRHLLPTL